MATITTATIDNRALLASIGHRKVRAVAAESTPYAAHRSNRMYVYIQSETAQLISACSR